MSMQGVYRFFSLSLGLCFAMQGAWASEGDQVSLQGKMAFGGVVLPVQKAKLAFAQSGVIAQVPRAGDFFKKGQVVAAVKDTQNSIAVEQARASLEAVNLELKSALHNQKKTQRLLDENIVSDIAVTEIEFSVNQAKARYREVEARYKAAKEKWRSCFVKAPFDGVVVAINAHLGEWAATGNTVLELVNLSVLELSVDLPPTLAHRIAPGLKTKILYGGKTVGEAKARTVMPYIDPASGLVRVIWEVQTSQDGIAGRYVTLAPWSSKKSLAEKMP